MGFTTLERMKRALLTTDVSRMEHAVLLDMASAVVDGSLLYSWGHDRLALAIQKEPRSVAAKSALSQRIIPSLIAKRLICKVSEAYPGHRAEYELLVLRDLEMGSGSDEGNVEMGSGSEAEWVVVSRRMGSAQTATPAPTSSPISAPGKRTASGARPPTKAQMTFIADLRSMLTLDDEQPQTFADAHAFIGEHWQEVQRRAHNGDGVDCSAADLSPEARRYAREHGLLLDEGTTA